MMRTLELKLLSLLVMMAGALLVAGVMVPTGVVTAMMPDLAATPAEGGVIDWRLVGGVAGVSFVLLGLTGLLPGRRLGAGKISFQSDHGEVIIELGPIQKTLGRVISTQPEVRSARVRVKPEKDGRRVRVRADVMLQNCADQGLRKTAARVSECISAAVSRAVGLEDLATVQLVIKGVHVDAGAAAQSLRAEVDTRTDQAVARPAATAPTRPLIASVTMEEPPPATLKPVAAPRPQETPIAVDEPEAAPREPEEVTLPPLSWVSADEPKAAAPEPVEEAKSAIEDTPFAVAAVPEKAHEDTTFRPE